MLDIFERTAVIPVLTIEDAEDAVPLARALLHGGLRVMEVTFRTKDAAQAIAAIAREVPDAIAGAGTLLRAAHVSQAVEAGARFLVSPGCSPEVASAGLAVDLPFIPGVATATEVMAARELGFSLLKFFPASAMGGPATLAAFAPVFPGIAFCPTGGITQEAAPDYLRLPNVPMVGGAWMAPAAAIAARDWSRIESLARKAAALNSP
ncbi:MAG TPA: bifunctional 4-hydroxy-2-oxoglutarate aldolase/2-dehydro-3-deoxy-phosphogluconate aldolase [Stellaceae bacterium]|nr:bifunctional 4-hydroxy-2-oxoglutarate aldolase/2-dehydro-3-deoxy-phosphogluconate aldolase [Stellaceae bacterium]